MLSPRKQGYYRDNAIYEAILRHKCLSQEQITLLFFQNMKPESALRQSQNRLKKLLDKNLIKRWRCDINEPYYYYVQDFAQKEHIVLLNWLFIYYTIMPDHKWDKIYWFDYQIDLEILKPDLFLITYNEFDKGNEYKGTYFEMDKTITNEFDKVKKYNKYLEEGNSQFQWWRNLLKKFPQVYIATTSKTRLNEINRKIQLENTNQFNKPIKFHSFYIDDIKGECLNAKKTDLRNFIHINTSNSIISSR